MHTGLSMSEKKKYLSYLSELIMPERIVKMEQVLQHRTQHLTIVLEDIYQSHNASAVLRSCDCFGLLDVHIIENRNEYIVNPDVALGSSKWLNLFSYREADCNTTDCIQKLKNQGYRIIATSPHKDDCSVRELPLFQKTALIFGNEVDGLSAKALEMADGFVKVPMYGFTESLNISVSAAICLYTLMEKLHNSDINWHLSPEEKIETLIKWVKNTLKKADLIEKEYFSRYRK
jgi:tRNA (guanosine-2'-O-)-methyltransferase